MDGDSSLALVAAAMLELYQKELIRLLKHHQKEEADMHEFTQQFDDCYSQVKAAASSGTPLETEILSVCQKMKAFLHGRHPHKSKHSPRNVTTHKAGRSSLTNPQVLQSAQGQKKEEHRRDVADIFRSYHLNPAPIRMVWRDAYSRQTNARTDAYAPNTINLAEALPQMEESVRRLSLQRPLQNLPEDARPTRPKSRLIPFLF